LFRIELAAAEGALTARGDKDAWLDLSKYHLAGVEELDRYTLRVEIEVVTQCIGWR